MEKDCKNVEIHTPKVGCTEELSVSCLGNSADHLWVEVTQAWINLNASYLSSHDPNSSLFLLTVNYKSCLSLSSLLLTRLNSSADYFKIALKGRNITSIFSLKLMLDKEINGFFNSFFHYYFKQYFIF